MDKILNNCIYGMGGDNKMLKLSHLGEEDMRMVCIFVATYEYMTVRRGGGAAVAVELPSWVPCAAWVYPSHALLSPRAWRTGLGVF